MDPKKLLASSAVAAVLTFGAEPADAQGSSNRGGGERGRFRRPEAAEGWQRPGRTERRRELAVPRESVRPSQEGRQQQEARPHLEGRTGRESLGRDERRHESRPRWRDNRRELEFRDRERSYSRRFEFRDHRRYDRRHFDERRFFGRVLPHRFYTPRPYRPGLHLDFGIFFGRPYAFRFAPPVPLYGYPAAAPIVAYGGVSLEIWPGDVYVYVDGYDAGIARSFSGGAAPLTLAAGWHRIELQAPGYEPMVFDVEILPGRVIPYHGVMQPAY